MWTAKDLSASGQKLKGEKLKAEIRVLERLLERAKVDALQFASELEKLPDAIVFLRIGTFWDCPKSTIGLCVYEHFEDRAHDDCIFCHDPEERK